MTTLIVGAGPVGLAAAVFLASAGMKVRVVEKRSQRSRESRALAVNPRTLSLLDGVDVSRRMEAAGIRILHGRAYDGVEPVIQLEMADLPGSRKYMLALSQAVTERLLEERLGELGVEVERGREVVACEEGLSAARVSFADGETVESACVLAADGARSAVRESLGVAFEGATFAKPWYLADLPLKTKLGADSAHIVFLEDGFLFLLRVVEQPDRGLWRVIGHRPNPATLWPLIEPAGEPVWSSEFRVSHRIVPRFSTAHVHFAGDAAHLHSPIGARGMNLGIEDAYVFAALAKRGELARYEALRRPIDEAVVRRVKMLTRAVRGESMGARFIRRRIGPLLAANHAMRLNAMRTLTGLDHDVSV